MSDFARERLRALAPGILLAFAAIAFGFGLGIAFGAAEHDLKDHLQGSAEAVLESVYAGDASKAEPVVKKSWSYFKRAHLHANALGTTALVASLLLALLGPPGLLARLSSFGLGFGALFYGAYWLIAGLLADRGSVGAGTRQYFRCQGIAGLAGHSERRGLCAGPGGYAGLFDPGDFRVEPRLIARWLASVGRPAFARACLETCCS
ncbi:MAG: hypothetical protein JRE57_14980 [Deltaproteobacteria bacterium]|nr:hypothetical protein [Deltaproteobacteria bacterium]